MSVLLYALSMVRTSMPTVRDLNGKAIGTAFRNRKRRALIEPTENRLLGPVGDGTRKRGTYRGIVVFVQPATSALANCRRDRRLIATAGRVMRHMGTRGQGRMLEARGGFLPRFAVEDIPVLAREYSYLSGAVIARRRGCPGLKGSSRYQSKSSKGEYDGHETHAG